MNNNTTTTVSLSHLAEKAKQAHYGTSFSPEKRGEQMISEYEAILAADLELIKEATIEAKELYKKRFIAHLSNYMNARGRIVSPMIAGPANFPVARMEKYRNWEQSAYDKFSQFREKALKGIQKQIERDKPQEQKQDETWARIMARIMDSAQTIIDIDTGINTYSARPLIVQNLAGFIQRIASNGQSAHLKKAIELIREINASSKKPIITEKNSIFKLVEKSEAIAKTKEDTSRKESTIYDFEGGQVILNYAVNRLQIQHDAKPPAEVIANFKRNGFKWSLSNKAWQLFLHNQSIYKVNHLLKLNIPSL